MQAVQWLHNRFFFLFPDVKPNGEIAKLQCSDYDVGNGICDPQCNFEHSLWDLGDCCQPFHTAFWCNQAEYKWFDFGIQKYSKIKGIIPYDLPWHSGQLYSNNYNDLEKMCSCHITGDNAAKPYGNQLGS